MRVIVHDSSAQSCNTKVYFYDSENKDLLFTTDGCLTYEKFYNSPLEETEWYQTFFDKIRTQNPQIINKRIVIDDALYNQIIAIKSEPIIRIIDEAFFSDRVSHQVYSVNGKWHSIDNGNERKYSAHHKGDVKGAKTNILPADSQMVLNSRR
jgi:hypothetical protein